MPVFLARIFGSLFGFIWIIIAIAIFGAIFSRVKKSGSRGMFSRNAMDTGFFALRGKTGEQKKIVKYFMSTGILGLIFKITDAEFENILGNKVSSFGESLAERALDAHGMDADEVKEIPPIRVENYYEGSRLFKLFRDGTFRACEYQMSYLMFSQKQMYVYSHTFDLTSFDTTEQTREYFYQDITSVDVTKKQVEFPNPRPMSYLAGGIGDILLGIVLLAASRGSEVIIFLAFAAIVSGILFAIFAGYTRSVVSNLVLRLTVAGDEFVCAMNAENISAIQGMKAKIREKKK